jgi:hypothetical protein
MFQEKNFLPLQISIIYPIPIPQICNDACFVYIFITYQVKIARISNILYKWLGKPQNNGKNALKILVCMGNNTVTPWALKKND